MQLDPGKLPRYTALNRRPRRSAARRMQPGGVFLFLSLAMALQLAVMPGPGSRFPTQGSDSPAQMNLGQTRLITPTPAPQPTPFIHAAACSLSQGTVVEDVIPIPGQVRDLPFRAYLPPCYDAESALGYPTLYFLHGLLGDDTQWGQAGALDRADALFSAGVTPTFIMIMPWEQTGLDLEPALVENLVPYVDQTFNTRPDAAWRGIGGLSRGGGQALQIGLQHADVFGQISLHSPAVLQADELILAWLGSIPAASRPSLWIDIGQRDPLFPTTMQLVELLLSSGYAPTMQINPGDHDLAYWRTHVETYLRWHAGLWLGQSLRTPAAQRPR